MIQIRILKQEIEQLVEKGKAEFVQLGEQPHAVALIKENATVKKENGEEHNLLPKDMLIEMDGDYILLKV